MTKYHCELGFVHCSHPVAGECEICGRAFCAVHGNHDLGICRSCLKDYLQAAEEEHLNAAEAERRDQVVRRNDRHVCGKERCSDAALVLRCRRCAGWFCTKHARKYSYTYVLQTPTGPEKDRGEIVLCEACAPHLRDYEKEQF